MKAQPIQQLEQEIQNLPSGEKEPTKHTYDAHTATGRPTAGKGQVKVCSNVAVLRDLAMVVDAPASKLIRNAIHVVMVKMQIISVVENKHIIFV